MKPFTQSYPARQEHLPAAGKHIVAQHDASHGWVYQVYKPSMAAFATRHGRFGATSTTSTIWAGCAPSSCKPDVTARLAADFIPKLP